MKALLTGAALALALSGAAVAQSPMPAQEPTQSTMPTQTPVPSTMPNANQTPEAPANGTMPNANGTATSGGAVAPNGTMGGTENPTNPNCPAGTTPAAGTTCPPPLPPAGH